MVGVDLRLRGVSDLDVWAEVAAGRRALADAVDRLDPAVLDADSWCEGWRGRDVLGHLVYLAEATQGKVLKDVLRFGPRPDTSLQRTATALGDRPVAELTGRLRAGAEGRFHVLGSPPIVSLGEVLVHGADLLRPAGVDVDLVDPAVIGPLLPVYRRLGRVAFHGSPTKGVTLVATDADLSIGRGPEVRGRAIDLLLLTANRRQVLGALGGPGVATLRF